MSGFDDVKRECKGFAAFCAQYGDAAGEWFIEQLGETYLDPKHKTEGIEVTDTDTMDVLNKVLHGYYEHDGDEYTFSVEFGNWIGCAVRVFDAGEKAKHRRLVPTRRVFTLIESREWDDKQRAIARRRFTIWHNSHEVVEKERAMNYDYHFDPCIKTYDHYRDWAAKHGVTIDVVAVAVADQGEVT